VTGHQRRAAGQFRQQLPARGLQVADVSQVKERGKHPGVDGARTPSKTCTVAPCRSTSMSSMLSAPGAVPATRQARLQVRKPSDRGPLPATSQDRNRYPGRRAERLIRKWSVRQQEPGGLTRGICAGWRSSGMADSASSAHFSSHTTA